MGREEFLPDQWLARKACVVTKILHACRIHAILGLYTYRLVFFCMARKKSSGMGILEVCSIEHDEHPGRAHHQDPDQSKTSLRCSRKRSRENPSKVLSRFVFSIRACSVLFLEFLALDHDLVVVLSRRVDLDAADNVRVDGVDRVVPGILWGTLPERCFSQFWLRVLYILVDHVRDVPLLEFRFCVVT